MTWWKQFWSYFCLTIIYRYWSFSCHLKQLSQFWPYVPKVRQVGFWFENEACTEQMRAMTSGSHRLSEDTGNICIIITRYNGIDKAKMWHMWSLGGGAYKTLYDKNRQMWKYYIYSYKIITCFNILIWTSWDRAFFGSFTTIDTLSETQHFNFITFSVRLFFIFVQGIIRCIIIISMET